MLAVTEGLHVECLRDAPSPEQILRHATPEDRPFALISGDGDPALSRWSYAALEPTGEAATPEHALAQMRDWIDTPLVPFSSGAVGYVSYDGGWAHALRPRVPRADPLDMPGARFLLYDAVYAYDRRTGDGYLIAQPNGAARLARLRRSLFATAPALKGQLDGPLAPGIDRATYANRIREALGLIADGEIYQVNLTYPLLGRFRGDPRAAFLRLTETPPPFAAYLQVDRGRAIVSASPECFFDYCAKTRWLRTYPIKGTARRVADPAADDVRRRQLIGDPKERAEHLMIVDLLRNDVGRLAEIGSVGVDGLAYVESFPTVHHLTSCVQGRLRTDIDFPTLMSALFPGGSITGAPKLRAMEIIDSLENDARGVYTGMIGYLTPRGSVRSAIAIRTAQISGEDVRFGVGGGIVADSDPDREYEETMTKAAALQKALG